MCRLNSLLAWLLLLTAKLRLIHRVSQASEDAKKLVNQENSFACAEIESARALVLRLGGTFEEQELCSKASRALGPVCIHLSLILLFICLF